MYVDDDFVVTENMFVLLIIVSIVYLHVYDWCELYWSQKHLTLIYLFLARLQDITINKAFEILSSFSASYQLDW